MIRSPADTSLTPVSDATEVEPVGNVSFVLDSALFLSIAQSLRVLARSEEHGIAEDVVRAVRDALAAHGRVLVNISPALGGSPDEDSETVEQLIEQLTPDLSVPSEARVVQARRNAQARVQLIQEFGALTGDQIGEEHSRAANRHALAARWRKERRIFAVPYRRQRLYPAFQFDADGSLRPVVREVLAALPAEQMSDWEVALWWTSGNGALGGRRPVDLLDDDRRALVEAARALRQPSPL